MRLLKKKKINFFNFNLIKSNAFKAPSTKKAHTSLSPFLFKSCVKSLYYNLSEGLVPMQNVARVLEIISTLNGSLLFVSGPNILSKTLKKIPNVSWEDWNKPYVFDASSFAYGKKWYADMVILNDNKREKKIERDLRFLPFIGVGNFKLEDLSFFLNLRIYNYFIANWYLHFITSILRRGLFFKTTPRGSNWNWYRLIIFKRKIGIEKKTYFFQPFKKKKKLRVFLKKRSLILNKIKRMYKKRNVQIRHFNSKKSKPIYRFKKKTSN